MNYECGSDLLMRLDVLASVFPVANSKYGTDYSVFITE
jgi:hypothetical protein